MFSHSLPYPCVFYSNLTNKLHTSMRNCCVYFPQELFSPKDVFTRHKIVQMHGYPVVCCLCLLLNKSLKIKNST